MSGNAAPLVPSTSSSANSIASATARTESAGLQRQVKPMPTMLRRPWWLSRVKRAGPWGGRPRVRCSVRQTTRRPDQSWSMAATLTSTSPIGSACSRITVSVMSLPWPAARRGQAIPQHRHRMHPPGEFGDLLADIVRVGEKGEDDVGAPVWIRVRQPGRRVGQIPAVGRMMQMDPLPGLEAELGRLRATRVPRRRHRQSRPAPMGLPSRARLSPVPA